MRNRRKNRWECGELIISSQGLKRGLYEEQIRELTAVLLQAYTNLEKRVKDEKILIENKKEDLTNNKREAS